jgi:hypothetical protein
MRNVKFVVSAVVLILLCGRNAAYGQHVLQSTNIHLEFSDLDPSNPERIDVVQWKGGPNLTMSFPGFAGCEGGDVEFWGNATAPPGGFPGRLVGAGTGGSWTAGADGLSAVVKSISQSCANSMRVPVTTYYQLSNDEDRANTIVVTRRISFGTGAQPFDFQPYVLRLYPWNQFYQVWHPNAAHNAVLMEDVSL